MAEQPDRMVQVVIGGGLLAAFDHWLAGRDLHRFPIPREAEDGTLYVDEDPDDDLPTYGVGVGEQAVAGPVEPLRLFEVSGDHASAIVRARTAEEAIGLARADSDMRGEFRRAWAEPLDDRQPGHPTVLTRFVV